MHKNKISRTFAIAITLAGTMLLNGCQNSANAPQSPDKEQQENTTLENSNIENSDIKNSEESPNETTIQETAPEESTSSEENSTENDVISNNIPQISITSDSKSWYTEDGNTLLLEETHCTVDITNDGFDSLADALRNWSKEHGFSDDADNMLLQSAKDHFSSIDEPSYFSNYYSSENIQIGRNDAHILSLIETGSDYMGGAHGNYGSIGYTFDVQSGKILALEDLLIDKEGFYAKATDYITDTLYELYDEGLYPEYKQVVADTWTGEYGVKYYLDASGIVIIYNPYEVGPYAMGKAHVTLPYSTFGEYFDTNYITAQGATIAYVPANKDISAFTGTTPPVMIEEIPDDYEFLGTSVISGTYAEDLTEGGRFESAYLIRRADGKSFLIISADYASDDYVTFVYDITNSGLQKCDELNGAKIIGTVNLDNIVLSMHLDVLGTYSGQMLYTIESDGTLTQSEDVFSGFGSAFEMTVTKKLPVTIDNNATTLPIGSVLTITGTNNIDTVYFITNDGKEGYINYTLNEEDWIHYIDGISEFEYFEMIPYAG